MISDGVDDKTIVQDSRTPEVDPAFSKELFFRKRLKTEASMPRQPPQKLGSGSKELPACSRDRMWGRHCHTHLRVAICATAVIAWKHTERLFGSTVSFLSPFAASFYHASAASYRGERRQALNILWKHKGGSGLLGLMAFQCARSRHCRP